MSRFIPSLGLLLATFALLTPSEVAAQGSRPASRPKSRPTSQPLQPAPKNLDLGGLHLKPDSGWKLRPTKGGWRKAELILPAAAGSAAGESGELIIYYFDRGGAGNAKSNLARWKQMFARPSEMEASQFAKEEQFVANGMRISVLTVHGTYLGPSFEPLPKPLRKHMMLAAMIETPEGPYYIRTLGPEKTLKSWQKSWLQLLRTAEPSTSAQNPQSQPKKPTSKPKE